YLFTNLPVNVSVPGNKVGVSVSLINKADLTYNLNLAPRLSVGLPSVGSNDGFIYLDQNTNGTFAGSERFQEIGNSSQPGPTNFRAIINATIPEPMSMMIVAPALIALRRCRR
ncbi:MAG TPA: hypothetical protein PK402_14360, partial [Tepidisphaeraceae bacterium]|nr:hypothetical protein [Tepidisphaeraceae bacterium]